MIWKVMIGLILISGMARAGNLLPNESLEQGEGKPAAWSAINFWGGKASFDLDSEVAHSGKRSFRISCGESTQAFLYSAAIPVAAGENLEASAWVKVQDQSGAGDVVMVANFFEGDGRTEAFADLAKVSGKGCE